MSAGNSTESSFGDSPPRNWLEHCLKPRRGRFPVLASLLTIGLFAVGWVSFYLNAREYKYVHSLGVYIGLGVVWILGAAYWHLQEVELPFTFFAGLAGVAVFGLGWLFSYTTAFARHYIETPAVYAGCLVLAWILGSVYWGLQQLRHLIDDLGSCFLTTNYQAFASKWKSRFFSGHHMLICGVVLFAMGGMVLYLGMFESFPPRLVDAAQGRTYVLPTPWHDNDIIEHFFLELGISGFVCVAGGAGLWLFLVNLPFLRGLLRLPVVPIPTALLTKFRPISDFYVVGTSAWFVAVGLILAIVFRNLSATALILLLAAVVIGLSAFIWPQIAFHIMIVRAQNQIANVTVKHFHVLGLEPNQNDNLSMLQEANETIKLGAMWVFDRGDVTTLLLPELITIAILILKSGVVGQHS